MKPIQTYFPHMTYDLTECKINTLEDGSVIVSTPAKWEVKEEQEIRDANDQKQQVKLYRVTEWNVRKLENI